MEKDILDFLDWCNGKETEVNEIPAHSKIIKTEYNSYGETIYYADGSKFDYYSIDSH